MIVVLCENFMQAEYAYDIFVTFLEENEPWSIKRCIDHAYTVETDEDLRYIFINSRYRNVYEGYQADFIESCDFFDGINEYYYFC